MEAYVQLICFVIVSINTAVDLGKPPAWQLTIPLLGLHRTVRDCFELKVIDEPQAQIRLEKEPDDSTSGPKSVAMQRLNFAAIIAFFVSLSQPKTVWMKILVANTTCCRITGNANINQRRQIIDQDKLPRRIQIAIDITTVFISHSAFFMLMTSESNENIMIRVLRCIVWFIPLAAIAIAIAMAFNSDSSGTKSSTKALGFCWLQICIWLGVAAFAGFGDLARMRVRCQPVGFGGLHQLQVIAVCAHHAAAVWTLCSKQDPVDKVSWPTTGAAGFWVGLVGGYVLYVPSIDVPERHGYRCR